MATRWATIPVGDQQDPLEGLDSSDTFREVKRRLEVARDFGAHRIRLELGLRQARDLFLITGRHPTDPALHCLLGVDVRMVAQEDHLRVTGVTEHPIRFPIVPR